ncbi:MAG: thioredoxin family protein [Proteobacteria bacterium]|nr:thioredoxin family protein [Pseudomonadota bacterium]MBU1596292.1 thioredoxin family protein [Pseudomonadota bacterium]
MMRRLLLGAVLTCLAATTALAAPGGIPVRGMVTLVDLGAKSCIPCRMMAPILEELEKAYQGKAAVVFIDVLQDSGAAKRFGIRSIPTQIFYDKKGREVGRHEGFMDRKPLADQLDKLLAQ